MRVTNYISAQFLYDRLAEQFKPQSCTDIFPKIGIQCHNTDQIKKVYTATFMNPAVVKKVLSRGEENVMLFTHHPVPPMISLKDGYGNVDAELLVKMKSQKVSFFSYHIPLDVAGPYSPGNTLARAMGSNPYDCWYPQNGAMLGALCQTGLQTVDQLKNRFAETLGHEVKRYAYGDNNLINGKFAIMAGCSKNPEAYEFLRKQGINVLVTGVTAPVTEWVQSIHQAAKANGITLLGGTHYSTEKFALIALCDYFRNFGIEAEFMDETPCMDEL